ncbi:MAG: 4-aminobutyrate--2-oxoglutarate transaminase [Dehalococcoidia bacterium]
MNNTMLQERRLAATPRGVGVMCDFYAKRALNATIWDVEGREYTDFAAGIAVLNTGHCNPAIVEAVRVQLECFTHTAYQIVPYENAVALAERINRLVPIGGSVKTAFFTTGAEAVENAIKIARAHTGRPGVIAFGGGFHGRTLMSMALTGKVLPYKAGFGPLPPSVYHVPFPSKLDEVSVCDSMRAFERLFKYDVEPTSIAAIIVEPVQGEGGFNVAPAELVHALRALCDRHGILLIADEIQTGFGRTGRMFAMHHYDIEPDLMTMAKSLSGGLPLSAVCGRAEIMDAPAPGGLGGTFAANPLAVAAAHAVLDLLEKERLAERAQHLGNRLVQFLMEMKSEDPRMAEVRGIGSMIAAEFRDPDTGEPDATHMQAVQRRALQEGLLLLSCGLHGNAIRFLYPLTIPEAQFEQSLRIISRASKG